MARVLITGISGFIAKHVALQLLQAGHDVVGTVRDASKAGPVKDTLVRHGADHSKISFVEADLTDDAGWGEAVAGCDYVQHLASPFPLEQPRDREALVPAAREGVLRVTTAALDAGVKRIVVTSSLAAVMYHPKFKGNFEAGPDDWSDPEWSAISPYIVSKTRAEQALWKLLDERGARDRATVINPGLVLGPALDERIGTSLSVVELLMKAAYPASPPICFPTVDVRDLAALHVAAMDSPNTAGLRLLAAADTVSMRETALILREAFPAFKKKIPTGELPAWLVRFLAFFDRSLRSVTSDLGRRRNAKTAYVTEKTGIAFRPAREAVIAAAESLIEYGIVEPPR
ncbi:NAD-dependent epimerase/dehydratase family protein [Hyphobacterium sp.]|jgi:dihydroflavonol-4-reductase|uniref:NAD-dependent epimerase/dehydratase family protein n=1 Tax=Hyphobacterium sp. TaxID=2004662 RepID=UPI003BABD11C